ncbi:hypothetical protein BC831DRAFT_449674 [Entophlyctis helioformis]|nr:hypothetical protein BC831DRAFT_452022 [Entophlyctis helioformis]KAI8928224.1 hypothetical protein BC831DRAFT_449674 [Entophlyctis helioformis]
MRWMRVWMFVAKVAIPKTNTQQSIRMIASIVLAVVKLAASALAIWSISTQSLMEDTSGNLSCLLWVSSDSQSPNMTFSLCVFLIWLTVISLIVSTYEFASHVFRDPNRAVKSGLTFSSFLYIIVAAVMLIGSCVLTAGLAVSCNTATQRLSLPEAECLRAFSDLWGSNLSVLGFGTACCWLATVIWIATARFAFAAEDPEEMLPSNRRNVMEVLKRVNRDPFEQEYLPSPGKSKMII